MVFARSQLKEGSNLLFNSYEFIFIFLPVTFFVYFYLNKQKLTDTSKGFLIISSLFFYSWWNIVYLPLIIVSMLFNFFLGKSLANGKEFVHVQRKYLKISRKSLLFIGVIVNLSLLGYFKYSDFIIGNINYILSADFELLHLALPLAISFFTFQQIAYLVDSYRRETREYDILNYAIFVTFFPQLIAGPIVHHKEMMPQFAKARHKIISYKNLVLGLFIFSVGLFKKVVIADTFSKWANVGFDTATTLSLFEAWGTSLSYTFQLYFDFSGYSDMAIGLALLFNIRLPINFNSPYKAVNIQDFWRRWHITLSRFLRDYVYIPLGGSKVGNLATYNNLMATFLLGGIWHGAGWTFVFWGFLHGLALVIQRLWSQLGLKLWNWFAWFITFNFINVAWIFFRANEWSDAVKILKGMVGFSGVVFKDKNEEALSFLSTYDFISFGNIAENIGGNSDVFIWIPVLLLVVLKANNAYQLMTALKISTKTAIFSGIIFTISLVMMSTHEVSDFLYFNF